MWTKHLIKSSRWKERGLSSSLRQSRLHSSTPPQRPDYKQHRFLLSHEWNERFTNLLHPHLFTGRREKRPSAASAFPSWFSEWMDALWGPDGLPLQPTVENMMTWQQVGERSLLGRHRWEVHPPMGHYCFTHSTSLWSTTRLTDMHWLRG